MKQIVYFRSNACAEELQSLFDEIDIAAVEIEAEKVRSLVAWCQREKILNGVQISLILIDMEGSDYGMAHVLSAVQILRAYSPAEIAIVYPEETEESQSLRQALSVEFRVDDFFYKQDPEWKEKIRRVLTGDSTPLSRAQEIYEEVMMSAVEEYKPFHLEQERKLTIAIVGAQAHIGTTTQVFALYHALKMNAEPAIWDANGQLITLLQSFYESKAYEDWYEINGIALCREKAQGKNIYLMDCGVLKKENVEIVSSADITVLVFGTKPWELSATTSAIQMLRSQVPNRLLQIASFTTPESAHELKPILGKMIPAPYHENPWVESMSDYSEIKKEVISILKEYK